MAYVSATVFLTKPFNDDVLLDAISGAIERSRDALRQRWGITAAAVAAPRVVDGRPSGSRS
jgi:hypothetical protein